MPMGQEFREMPWRSADGRRIPIKDLEVGHFVNILNWVHERSDVYPPNIYIQLVQEAEYRKFIDFASGNPWPEHNGKSWELKHPVTGQGYVQPPPQAHLDKIAELGLATNKVEE